MNALIEYLSNVTTLFLINNKIILPEEREIYKYGSEVTISTLIGYVIIISIGLILGCVQDSILFLLCFVSIRLYSGGYHANTYVKCNTTFVSIFLVFRLVKNNIPLNVELYFSLILMTVSLFVIVLFSPIENIHKPLSPKEKIKYKRISILLSCLWSICATASYYLGNRIIVSISVTMILIAALMVVEIIKQKKVRHNHEK